MEDKIMLDRKGYFEEITSKGSEIPILSLWFRTENILVPSFIYLS